MGRGTLLTLAGLLTAVILFQCDTPAALGRTNDHFESRRRDAELRREQAAQAWPRRPWGGPTTGENWWTPVRPCPPRCGCPLHHHFHRRPVLIPGHYRWIGGRLIYVPAYHPYGLPQHIHIEQIIER